ncbi:unnamed protein product [Durusdinium trenchii]|uniref:Phospholipase B-like n=1 Tax=Durusdinium trenchii TaxID=1381693 RepID=A0ABP0I3D7_9DINO
MGGHLAPSLLAVQPPPRLHRFKASKSPAWATLADRLNETGWMELHVNTPTESFFSNDLKMYSAGLVEGMLSAERLSQFYSNFYPLLAADEESSRTLMNIRNLFSQQVHHILHVVGLSGGFGEEPADPYWKQVRYLFLQMWGIKDAYNLVAKEKGVGTIDMVDMFFINAHAELPEMMQAYSPEATAQRQGAEEEAASTPQQRGEKVFLQLDENSRNRKAVPEAVDRDWKLRLAKRGHCSALVRLAPSNSELLVGHSTWSDYGKMTRIFKYYRFHLPLSFQSNELIALSSYPGCVSSTDDFYMTDNGLTIMDTSLEVLNPRVYDRISEDPKRPRLPRFLHVMATNRVAKTGTQWTSMLASESLGTGNSQWLVVDYNRFTPNQPLQDNALRLLEQLPGFAHQADVTAELSSRGAWGSFNRPFFQDVRRMSGHEQAEATWGKFYSFAESPRAQLLQRLGASVGDLSGMRSTMTRNSPEDLTPGQPSGPGHAIMARLDLDPMVNNIPNGGIDAKVTNSCLLKAMQCQAISGPSHSALPAFRWTTEVDGAKSELFQGWPHLGLPDVWDFDFVQMTPKEESPASSKLSDC